MNVNHLNHYKSTQILTADPAKIILMLYDGAISFLQQAAQDAAQRAYPQRAKKITRANNILLELLASLDFENGGEIARNLREIYVFLVKELLKADNKNDSNLILQCSGILETIRTAWAEISNANATSLEKPETAETMNFSFTA